MTDSLPIDASGLTPEWLSGALAARHPGVRVAAVEVLDETERTNHHVWLRLTYDVSAGAPETLFCKLPPLNAEHRTVIGATGMGTREVRFYADAAAQTPMRMPAAYFAAAAPDGDFVLLLEDLTAAGCSISDGSWAVPGTLAAGAIADMAGLHVHFEDAGRLASVAPWAGAPRPKAPEFVMRTLRHVVDNCAGLLNDAYLTVAQMYIDHHDVIDVWWDGGPQTLIHGDAHIGNLFIDDNRVGFLDWGMARIGPPLRDISFFLTMGMESADRRAVERDLVRHYLDVRRTLGGDEITFADAWLAHRVHAGYTVLASFLTMVPPYNTEARRMFTSNFRARAMAALDDLDTVGALEGIIHAAARAG